MTLFSKITAAVLVTGIATGALLFSSIVSAWTGNATAPPGNNTSAPINVSGTAQNKNGSLGMNGLMVYGTSVLNAGWNPVPSTITYLNFSNAQYPTVPVTGAGGYGIEDNNGTLYLKNSGGSWQPISTGAGFTSTGSSNFLPYFTSNGNTVANSIISQSGGAISVNGSLSLQSGGTLQVGNNYLYNGSSPDFKTTAIQASTLTTTSDVTVGGKITSTGDITATSRFCLGSNCIGVWPSGGTSQWTTSGTIIYYNSGNVGINTPTPQEPLDVNGNIAVGNGTAVSASTAYPSGAIIDRGGKSNLAIDVQDGYGRVNYLWNASSGGGTYLVASEPAARILESIATVNGGTSANTADFGLFSAPGSTAGAPIAWTQIADFNVGNVWLSPRGTSSDFYINSSGNVGIDTASPQQALDVNGVARMQWGGELGTTGSYLSFNAYWNTVTSNWTYRNTDYGYFIRHDGSDLGFYTMPSGTAGSSGSPTQTMYLTSSGLTVNGNGIYNSAGYQIVQTNATDWLRINQNGSWASGIAMFGNVALGSGGLSVGSWGTAGAGNIQASGSVTAGSFLYSSDQRLKKNIAPLTGNLAKVLAIQPVSYLWKDSSRGTGEQIGFIAQNVQKVAPEIVHTDASTTLESLDYARVTPLLVGSVQELDQKIGEQQREIDELKDEISQLKNK